MFSKLPPSYYENINHLFNFNQYLDATPGPKRNNLSLFSKLNLHCVAKAHGTKIDPSHV